MKKLMMAAAIVCAAAFAQASAINWTSTGKLVDKAGTVITAFPEGSAVAIILASNTGWSEGTWTAAAGSVTELGGVTIGTAKAGKGVGSGSKGFTYGTTLENGDVVAVVFKDANGAYSQLVYQADKSAVTDTLTVSGLDDDKDSWNKTLTFASKGNFMGPAQDVPEPTSAMLLLLGVAGLALKRKRA